MDRTLDCLPCSGLQGSQRSCRLWTGAPTPPFILRQRVRHPQRPNVTVPSHLGLLDDKNRSLGLLLGLKIQNRAKRPVPPTHLQGKGQAGFLRPRTLSRDSLAAGPGRELLRVRRVGGGAAGAEALGLRGVPASVRTRLRVGRRRRPAAQRPGSG